MKLVTQQMPTVGLLGIGQVTSRLAQALKMAIKSS